MRAAFYGSTICYLKNSDKVLFLKFSKKWGQVYAPPGGKINEGETPTECIIREFKEEAGIELINPTLKGISYWKNKDEGIIFIYVADEYRGELLNESIEGKIEWIKIDDIGNVKQFDMNEKFSKYIFEDGLFEGKFILNEDNSVESYTIRKI
jgi:8-oxo-dGTP diphosphatase